MVSNRTVSGKTVYLVNLPKGTDVIMERPDNELQKIKKENFETTDLTLQRSNALIGAKYNASLLENKLVAIGIARWQKAMRNHALKNKTGDILVKLSPNEINSLVDRKKNIYRDLKDISKSIMGRLALIDKNDGSGEFHYFTMITDCYFKNGWYCMKFNGSVKDYIYDLERKGDFTIDRLATLVNLSNNNTYRIYEILHRNLYQCNSKVHGGVVKVEYGLAEFKFMIGVADTEEKAVKKVIDSAKGDIDWDYILDNVATHKKYNDWYEFKRKALIPAQKEIKEKTDLSFEFEGVSTVGKRVRKLIFYIQRNTPKSETIIANEEKKKIINNEILSKNDEDVIVLEDQEEDVFDTSFINENTLCKKYVGHNSLTKANINLFLKLADNDEKLVETAIRKADQQKRIENYVAWINECIKANGYPDVPISVENGSSETANTMDRINKEMHSEDFKKKMWKRIREKDDFKEFLEKNGVDELTFNLVYETYDSKVEAYTQWRIMQMKNDIL